MGKDLGTGVMCCGLKRFTRYCPDCGGLLSSGSIDKWASHPVVTSPAEVECSGCHQRMMIVRVWLPWVERWDPEPPAHTFSHGEPVFCINCQRTWPPGHIRRRVDEWRAARRKAREEV